MRRAIRCDLCGDQDNGPWLSANKVMLCEDCSDALHGVQYLRDVIRSMSREQMIELLVATGVCGRGETELFALLKPDDKGAS